MNYQEFEQLFNYNWFEHQIFSPKSTKNQIHEDNILSEEPTRNSFSPTPLVRSHSDQNLNSSSSASDFSPNSVLRFPKLETILSGKEVEYNVPELRPDENAGSENVKKGLDYKRRRNRGSKSLSELEIEELKGFMDLGFEFKDEDKDSSLVLIVPGLQRLGKKDDDEEEENRVSRPYLSEAWDGWEKKKKGLVENQPLINWRIPALGDEMELKNQLRFWAHAVASNVR